MDSKKSFPALMCVQGQVIIMHIQGQGLDLSDLVITQQLKENFQSKSVTWVLQIIYMLFWSMIER